SCDGLRVVARYARSARLRRQLDRALRFASPSDVRLIEISLAGGGSDAFREQTTRQSIAWLARRQEVARRAVERGDVRPETSTSEAPPLAPVCTRRREVLARERAQAPLHGRWLVDIGVDERLS